MSAAAASRSSLRIDLRGSLACKSSRVARKVSSACAKPFVPARGRGPRSSVRSSAATAWSCAPCRFPSRSRGCLSSASSGTGLRPPRATSAVSRANRPAPVSASASPPESSTFTSPACERGHNAAGERAIRRHQRDGLVLIQRFAHRHRNGERFFLGIGRFDQR